MSELKIGDKVKMINPNPYYSLETKGRPVKVKQDYSRDAITVKSQKELDMIPDDYKGKIYIEFGTCYGKAVVNKKYYNRVEARGNSSVVARENSSVEARGNSSVEARGNSSVVAWGNSSVEARENSSVVAWGNTQVVDRQYKGKIQIFGNARTVYMPKSIHEFMDFYGIKHTKAKAIFYKAVRKTGDVYYSDHNNKFVYEIGKIKQEKCDDKTSKDCSYGIHISYLDWALAFGASWDNLAIIEVETSIKDIVLPNETDGKVRTSKIKVLREVPLEECGVFGKIIARRRLNGYYS